VAASAVVGRVADIASEFVSDERQSEPLLKSGARASAQRRVGKNLRAPVRAVTSYSLPRGGHRISDSVRACAARLYGE